MVVIASVTSIKIFGELCLTNSSYDAHLECWNSAVLNMLLFSTAKLKSSSRTAGKLRCFTWLFHKSCHVSCIWTLRCWVTWWTSSEAGCPYCMLVLNEILSTAEVSVRGERKAMCCKIEGTRDKAVVACYKVLSRYKCRGNGKISDRCQWEQSAGLTWPGIEPSTSRIQSSFVHSLCALCDCWDKSEDKILPVLN